MIIIIIFLHNNKIEMSILLDFSSLSTNSIIIWQWLAFHVFCDNFEEEQKALIDVRFVPYTRKNWFIIFILRHINFDLVKCVILASPGFVKDQFMDYMIQQAVKSDNKIILENKSKFLLVHASSGFKHSLKEVLADPAVISRISDTKAAGEVRALETFYTTLQMDPARAFYGKKHVEKANTAQAVETLLISDKLFRCQNIALRKEYVELVENVKDSGGDVKIFSSLHVSGEQLDQLTGIAALLRFPMPELEDESDEGSDSEDG